VEVVGKFWRISPISSFTQIHPVSVEFLDVERQDRHNEADSNILQLLFEQVGCNLISKSLNYFFFCGAAASSGLGLLIAEISMPPTIRRASKHTTRDRSPLTQRSTRRRGHYPHNTQQTQETKVHAHSEM